MKKIFFVMFSCLVLAACSRAPVNTTEIKDVNEFAPYPSAQVGFTRSVIYLPQLANESENKVEVIIGKEMKVDCNIQRLVGNVKQETLDGWGYDYYVVETNGNAISTMMACPATSETTKFVSMMTGFNFINYNSRLPIVVYAPSDLQVKYRVWSANSDEVNSIKQ